MIKHIYAIQDTRAETIVGGIHLFNHHAPAVRFFADIASDEQTMVARHIGDHQLLYLGTVEEESGQLHGNSEPIVIITGAAWKAAQAEDTK